MVIQHQGRESDAPLLNSTAQSEISRLFLFLKVLPQTGESPCKNWQVWYWRTPSSNTVILPRMSFVLLSLLSLTWSMGISTCCHPSAVVKQSMTSSLDTEQNKISAVSLVAKESQSLQDAPTGILVSHEYSQSCPCKTKVGEGGS